MPAESPLPHHEWLIIVRQQQTSDQAESVIQLALPVAFPHLMQCRPDLISQQRQAEWDEQQSRLVVWLPTTLGKIVLSAIPAQQVQPEEYQAAILDWIGKKGLSVIPWNDEACQLRERIACAGRWLDAD